VSLGETLKRIADPPPILGKAQRLECAGVIGRSAFIVYLARNSPPRTGKNRFMTDRGEKTGPPRPKAK
jgi:hypothetical protein